MDGSSHAGKQSYYLQLQLYSLFSLSNHQLLEICGLLYSKEFRCWLYGVILSDT